MIYGRSPELRRKFAMSNDPSPLEKPPESERRKAAEANAAPVAKEFQGPKGPEPTRYGDWENKGIASDF
jgi:hypothetical protein